MSGLRIEGGGGGGRRWVVSVVCCDAHAVGGGVAGMGLGEEGAV